MRAKGCARRYINGNPKNEALYEPAKQLDTLATLDMGQAGQQQVGYFHVHRDDVDWVFVDHACYHRPGMMINPKP